MKIIAKLIGSITGGLAKSICYIIGAILGITFLYFIIFSFSLIMQAVNNVGVYVGLYLNITFGEFMTAIIALILLATLIDAIRGARRKPK
jgi:hypothetical protein